MVRDYATNLLNLIRKNDGLSKEDFLKDGKEIKKIIDIVLGECRCSVIDEKGNYARYGSSTDIRIINLLVQKLISNSNKIPPEIVSMALTKEGVIGPFKKINIQKKYDQDSKKYDLDIEEIFPNDFHVNMFKDDMEVREKFLVDVLKPYVKNIILENELLMSKSPITSYFNKYIVRLFTTPKTDEELTGNLKSILKSKLPNTSDELIDNISSYIFVNIMNNKYFKDELIDRTLSTTELQKLGRISIGFNSLADNMAYETLQMIELRNFPYGEIFAIKDTFYTLVAVLEALSINFENLSEDDILKKIEFINKNFDVKGRKNDTNATIYRTAPKNSSKYGDSMKFVEPQDINRALINICKMIKILLSNKDEIDDEAYLKEVLRIQYRLIRISAFEGANGRTIRLITNILLQSKGLIGIFRKEKRKDYIAFVDDINRVIKRNEEKYMDALVNNPMECNRYEDEAIKMDAIPFILIKG